MKAPRTQSPHLQQIFENLKQIELRLPGLVCKQAENYICLDWNLKGQTVTASRNII